MKPSALDDAPEPHRHWQRIVDVAYFRLLGWTQKEAAAAVGINQRTVREYESHAAWPEAVKSAGDRWHTSLAVRARGTLYQDLDPKRARGDLALKVLERLDMRLAPPNQRYQHSGVDGGPIETKQVHVYIPDNRRNPNERFGNGGSPSGDQAPLLTPGGGGVGENSPS